MAKAKDKAPESAPEPETAPEPVAPALVLDAGAALYRDKSGPIRELQPTEGKGNFGTMTREARISVGLDPETGLPKEAA